MSLTRQLLGSFVLLCSLVVVQNASATTGTFTNVGPGSICASGSVPVLTGAGTLAPASLNSLTLTGVTPGVVCFLVVGFSAINVPFKGGILGPAPNLIIPVPTNTAGGVFLPFTWPNVPAGTMVWLQFWCPDPILPWNYCSSNTLKITSR